MIGQKELHDKLNNLTLSNMPQSLILLGKHGCGKDAFCREIILKLNIPVIDVAKYLDDNDTSLREFIDAAYLRPEPFIYVFDVKDLTIKDQNAILKFLEDPSKNIIVIIKSHSKNQLLSTILNRCQIWEFKPYTTDELKQFLTSNNDLVIQFAETPGRVKELENSPLQEMINLSNKILLQIHNANTANILTIPSRINFKDDDSDKFNFDLFTEVLLHSARNLITEDKISSSAYFLTSKLVCDRDIPNINKQHLFENYLLTLRGLYN